MDDSSANAGNGERSSQRNRDLWRGIRLHALVLLVTIGLLFVVNWTTRGPDGGWWFILPLEIWASAWALHVFAVTQISHFRRDLDELD